MIRLCLYGTVIILWKDIFVHGAYCTEFGILDIDMEVDKNSVQVVMKLF